MKKLSREGNLGFVFLKLWMEDYEERVGDGAARKFYEWCIENYLPENLEEFLGEKQREEK